MYRVALKRASASVTVQAFAIVVGLIELDVFRPRRGTEILDVDMPQASELGAKAAIKTIVGVTGVAGFIGRNTMVLKMSGRDVGRIVHVKAFPVGLHDVAGKAKFRLLGTFDMGRRCHGAAEHGKDTEGDERQHLPGSGNGYRGTHDDDRDENRRDHKQGVQ